MLRAGGGWGGAVATRTHLARLFMASYRMYRVTTLPDLPSDFKHSVDVTSDQFKSADPMKKVIMARLYLLEETIERLRHCDEPPVLTPAQLAELRETAARLRKESPQLFGKMPDVVHILPKLKMSHLAKFTFRR